VRTLASEKLDLLLRSWQVLDLGRTVDLQQIILKRKIAPIARWYTCVQMVSIFSLMLSSRG
jgi:hypothetical protein